MSAAAGGEEGLDLPAEGRPVGLEGEQIVAAAVDDGLGDLDLGPDGVDGDERAGQVQALQQQRDGDDFVGLVGDRLLRQHQALAARPGRDQMQRRTPFGPGVGPPGGLAVDRDDLRSPGRASPRPRPGNRP